MRLYKSVKSPSEILKKINNFFSTVCASGWFNIKMNPESGCCPKHLQNILKFFSKLSEDNFFAQLNMHFFAQLAFNS